MHINEIKIQQKSNHHVHYNDQKHDNDIKRIMTHYNAYEHRCQKNQQKHHNAYIHRCQKNQKKKTKLLSTKSCAQ